jgi:hypothetical protein
MDQFILMCQGQPPYIGKKNVYYEDAVFRGRLFPPAFQMREEALHLAREAIAKINGTHWFNANRAAAGIPRKEVPDEYDETTEIPELSEAQTAALTQRFEEPDDYAEPAETGIFEEQQEDPDPAGSDIFEDTEETANFYK